MLSTKTTRGHTHPWGGVTEKLQNIEIKYGDSEMM